jgi:hypothetical protein
VSSNTYALNYELSSLSVKVGSFDITQYIDSLTVGAPPISIDIPQLFTGSFSLSCNAKAIADGLDDTDFSEFYSPSVWRKGQAKVEIIINGYTLPILRIDEYKYDDDTHVGEGTLVQLPAFFDVFNQKELVSVSPKVGGTPLPTIIGKLLDEVRGSVPGSFTNDNASLEGSYDLPVYFSDITKLIQQFCGTQQTFIWCDKTEKIKFRKVNLFEANSFVSPKSKYEAKRNLNNINFAAEVVKVTGNKEVAKLPPTEETTGSGSGGGIILGGGSSPPDYTDEGYPVSFQVVSKSTYGAVFGDLKDNVGNSLLTPGNIDTPIVNKIETYYYTYGVYTSGENAGKKYRISEQISTQKLAGEMYGKLTDSDGIPLITSLNVASILEFSSVVLNEARGQTVTTTKGQAYANAKSATGTTVIDSLPVARQTVVLPQEIDARVSPKPPYFVPPTPKNPNTGGSFGIQPGVTPESPQAQSEYDYTTEIYTGTCTINPVGWSAFLPKQLSIDVGFIPSQAIAQKLACWISRIELGRRDATEYTLPVPNEWLANGCVPFQLAYMHDRICLIDQPTIDIIRQGENGVSVEFSFLGIFLGLVATLPDPAPPTPKLAISGLSVKAQESIFVVSGVAIAPITFVASGGNTPYTWSSSALPSGLSLSSGGVLSGTPSSVGSTNVTVTVTDASAATANTSFTIIVTGAVVPDPGFVSVYTVVNSATSGGKVTLGVRGTGLNVSNSATSGGRVTDVTPPIINLIDSAISSGSVS